MRHQWGTWERQDWPCWPQVCNWLAFYKGCNDEAPAAEEPTTGDDRSKSKSLCQIFFLHATVQSVAAQRAKIWEGVSNACYFPCTYMYCTVQPYIYLWPHWPKPMQAFRALYSQQTAVKMRIYTGKATCILMRERESVCGFAILNATGHSRTQRSTRLIDEQIKTPHRCGEFCWRDSRCSKS